MFPVNFRKVGRPGLAALHQTSSSDSGSGTDVVVAFNATDALDGFTLTSNVLTSRVEGLFEITLCVGLYQVSGTNGAFVGYRKNGGATQSLAHTTNTTVDFRNIQFTIPLKYGDTIEIRIVGGSSTVARAYYPQLTVKQVSEYYQ